jgi:RNA-directed DNA polymerase
MILEPPESVQKLQAALQAKAKEAPGYRFYLLYDKLYRKDVLGYAYRCCRANAGAPGVDGQDFADIEKYGEERWLGELADTLRRKTYRAEAVRRVWIPKADGKKLRPLGIPTVSANYPGSQRVFGMGRSSTSIPPAERPAFPGP